MNLLFIEKLLAKAGFTDVVTSTDSRSAEAFIVSNEPDLVILDLHMPHLSGFDLLAALRGNQALAGFLPVLVFTADATGEARKRALELGATDFLTKPGDPTEVVLRVRNFLTMRYFHCQLESQRLQLEEKVIERTRSLYEAQLEVVHRLALAGDYRDDDTGGHCHRVGDVSYKIACECGLYEGDCELIRLAAPLHDIGKVGIADKLLRKPGRLTPEEFEQIKAHTEIGAEILANSKSEILQVAHVIARSHHERWDGTGYCRKLAGEEIPLAGRIVAVADVFDALTSERPYKHAWTVDEAVAEIERAAGTQFDPLVVQAFVSALARTKVDELRVA